MSVRWFDFTANPSPRLLMLPALLPVIDLATWTALESTGPRKHRNNLFIDPRDCMRGMSNSTHNPVEMPRVEPYLSNQILNDHIGHIYARE